MSHRSKASKVQSTKYKDQPLTTCASESTIATIVQSVGVSSRLKGKLASLPRHQKTNSPTPAPAASTATRGLPCGSRSLLSDCTMSSLRFLSESFFTVATTVPITRASCISKSFRSLESQLRRWSLTVARNNKSFRLETLLGPHNIDRIDDPDYGRIHRRIFHVLRQARAGSGHDQHALMKTGADCINSDDVAARIGSVEVNGPNDEQLFSLQSLVLLGRNDCADDARYDHPRDWDVIGIASSTLPCGRGITCTLTNSPTRRAAAAPASVAAFTAATSPRTMAVTNPAPIFS